MSIFKISQTCYKEFREKGACHYQKFRKWVTKDIKDESNIYMDRGKYFEYLCIGASASDIDVITDLPRLKNGEKSAEQKRIEYQAEIFKKNMDDLGYTIKDVQLVIEDDEFRGVIDFIAEKDGVESIWDIKLTASLDSKFSSSQYRDLSTADFTQQGIYRKKLHEIQGKLLDTYLYIADYSPELNVKVAKIDISLNTISEIKSSIIETKHMIDMYIKNQSEIPYSPSYKKCSECKLFDTCSKAERIIPIEVVSV